MWKERAISLLMDEVAARKEWQQELSTNGKMFGILVVEMPSALANASATPPSPIHPLGDGMGFLAAYSGQIGGRSDWAGFVPAVFDYLQEDGYFKTHEAEISKINDEVKAITDSYGYQRAIKDLEHSQQEAHEETMRYQQFISEHKSSRTPEEAQYQNAELRRIKKRWQQTMEQRKRVCQDYEDRLLILKRDRIKRSDALQRWLFENFILRSISGKERSVLDVFTQYAHHYKLKQQLPPSGMGECCAPKLLHYAATHGLKPLELSEVWYGPSPKGEVRHHGMEYEPCQAKCQPILWFMLDKGIDEMDKKNDFIEPTIIYEDDWLIAINKPHGILSVPGRHNQPNAEEWLRSQRNGFIKMVHRLDMDTSGVLIAAKSEGVYKSLQQLFAHHNAVRKTYIAYVCGIKAPATGTISLPLAPDFSNRPRQCVDHANGKRSITLVQDVREVVQSTDNTKSTDKNNNTNSTNDTNNTNSTNRVFRLELQPLTGRTHQLRLHCAHEEGLGMPIIGDVLYGNMPADHMYLQAKSVTFTHPVTGKETTISVEEETL